MYIDTHVFGLAQIAYSCISAMSAVQHSPHVSGSLDPWLLGSLSSGPWSSVYSAPHTLVCHIYSLYMWLKCWSNGTKLSSWDESPLRVMGCYLLFISMHLTYSASRFHKWLKTQHHLLVCLTGCTLWIPCIIHARVFVSSKTGNREPSSIMKKLTDSHHFKQIPKCTIYLYIYRKYLLMWHYASLCLYQFESKVWRVCLLKYSVGLNYIPPCSMRDHNIHNKSSLATLLVM